MYSSQHNILAKTGNQRKPEFLVFKIQLLYNDYLEKRKKSVKFLLLCLI